MDVSALRPEHHDSAVALWHDAGLTRPWNDPHADLERALAGPSSTVLGGYVDDVLVGIVMVGHDGHRGWVYYLAVRADSRRKGIGASMMRAGEQWLKEQGVVKVQLMVRTDNAATGSFYGRLGYEASDVRVLARWLDQPAIPKQPPV